MKVLTPGRKQKGWAKESICTGKGNGEGGCGAVLLVEEDDMYLTFSSHYDGSTDQYNTFKCCCCGVETDIKDVPTHVRDKMREKRAVKMATAKKKR